MTGFASCELETAQGHLTWELRSVNHRFLETQFKLPDGLRSLEPKLRELAAAKLRRGKVDGGLTFRPSEAVATAITVNDALAGEVIKQANALQTGIAAGAGYSGIDVLRWPGVVTDDAIDLSALHEPALELLDKTLGELSAHRGREGERIEAALEERLVQVTAIVKQVREHLPTVLAAIRERLLEKVQTLEAKLDNDRLEQEIVLLAQKMDVAEELDRLDAHIEETRSALSTEGAVGRRLDFLMQEFNREANTLGSKSQDAETTKAAVDLKVLIEQMREQVQNVE